MKLTLSCFALVLLTAVPAYAAPAYVQSGYGECLPATVCTTGFGMQGVPELAVLSGSLLVMNFRSDTGDQAVLSVTSTPAGCTWARDRAQLSITNIWLEVWSCPDAPAGLTDVTVRVESPADAMRITLTEYTGVAASSHVEATNSATNGTSSSTAGNIITTGPNRLIHVATITDSDPDSWTPGPNYTMHYLGGDPGGSDKTATQHRVVTTAGTYGTTMNNVNDSWASVAVAYKPSGGGSTAPPPAAPLNLRIIR